MVRFPLVLAALALVAGPCGAVAQIRTTRPSRITETSSHLHFVYSYPSQAAAIPKLAALLRKQGLESLAESRQDAAGRRRPRHGPDEVEQAWEVTADTRDLLALSSMPSTYQDGSPHGYFGYRTLIWSRRAQRAVELAELFADRERGVAQLMAGLCARLDAARATRWRERGNGQAAPMACPAADEVAIVPVAQRGGRIRSFRMMLSGEETPDGYAGGSYEVEAPVTPAIAALIEPSLRGSF